MTIFDPFQGTPRTVKVHDFIDKKLGKAIPYGELIAHTTTEAGLEIHDELDTNTYEKGIVVTKEEFDALALKRAEFHGEWNNTLTPRELPA